MELAEIAAARIIALILLRNPVSRTLPEDAGKSPGAALRA
jgi:hypothetical protein